MSKKTAVKQKWALASYALQDAYTDFILSRQAMLCSPSTLSWYRFTLGKVMQWLEAGGITSPDQLVARDVRAYLAELAGRGLSDSYIHSYARAIRTLVRFWYAEKYLPEPITFQMPTIAKKRLPVLSAKEVNQVLSVCNSFRDKALFLLMVDSGLRRAEVCALNWGDVEISSGLIRVAKGKGGKARSVVVGVKTRRTMLAYRRGVNHLDDDPLFQTRSGKRLTHSGLRSALLRIGQRAGIHISPHALRRTFATLSLRAGMNLLHLQGLLGHSTIEMTRRYVQMIDDDLIKAHREHGPIDNSLKSYPNST